MKNPIRGVVPHPGATFPYSELSGFKIIPNKLILGLPLGVSSITFVAIESVQLIEIYWLCILLYEVKYKLIFFWITWQRKPQLRSLSLSPVHSLVLPVTLCIQLPVNPPKSSETPLRNMKISRTGRPSFAKLKRKVSNQLNSIFKKSWFCWLNTICFFERALYLFLLGTLGGSRKKMAKKIIPKVATNKNV